MSLGFKIPCVFGLTTVAYTKKKLDKNYQWWLPDLCNVEFPEFPCDTRVISCCVFMPLTLMAPNVSVNTMLRPIRVDSPLGVLHLNYTPFFIGTLHIFWTLKVPDSVYVSRKAILINVPSSLSFHVTLVALKPIKLNADSSCIWIISH